MSQLGKCYPITFFFVSRLPVLLPARMKISVQGAQVLNALQETVLEVVGELGIQIRFPGLQPIL